MWLINRLKKSVNEFRKFTSTIAWCLSLSWKSSKFYTITRIVCSVFPPALVIAASFTGKYVINLLAGQRGDNNSTNTLLLLLVGIFVIAVFRVCTQKSAQYCQAMHDDIMNGRIALMMMEHSLSADLEYFDNSEYYDKLISANRDSHAMLYITLNTLNFISSAISFLGAFLILCQVNVLYGLAMMAAAIPSSLVASKYTQLVYRLSLDQINGQRRMNYCQSIAADKDFAQDLRLFNAEEKLKSRYAKIWESLFTKRQKLTRKRTFLSALLECLPEIVVALIGMDIALHVIANNATVGDYSLYTGLVGQLWLAISMLLTALVQILDNQMKIENFRSIENYRNHVLDNGKIHLESVETIVFEDVSFSYPGIKQCALQAISFSLHKDEKVALVGLNGSGKSTLIKLLVRMYDPDKGKILINGIDIKEYKLTSLRANFSVYFQDMRNYCFTLRENFTIADDNKEDVDGNIDNALNMSYCHDIISKMPKGLDSSITRLFDPDGIELSGGQHQKLALARALFRQHSCLILDEPSSNLDPKAEKEVFENLKIITQGKMTIFTSHRLSNVFLADRIIVLEKGCVVEDGTQKELLKNKHRFAELFKYQQDKYLASEE